MSIDGKHPCPWPGCTKRVGWDLWGCPLHWYMLPPPMRHRIYRAWWHGTAAQHSAALQAADEWSAKWIAKHE